MDPNFKRLLEALVEKLPSILDKEGIEYYTYNNRIAFSCPIHGSNKKESLSVFTEESHLGLVGNWKCFTKGCEDEVGRSIFSLLRSYFEISKNLNKFKAGEYVRSLVDIENVEYDTSNIEFTRQVKILQRPIVDHVKTFNRNILSKLELPSKYYQGRGFTLDTLKRFEIGDCKDPTAKFRHRSIIPVFNQDKTKIVNFIARSVYDKCNLCDEYHDPSKFCPTTDLQKYYASKWLNFSALGNTFYNLWNAKEAIASSNSCILVESASDIWRLHECGIHNSLALLTNNISYEQKLILESLPITTITLCLDNDDSGQVGIQNIISKIKSLYTLKILIPHKKDLTDMTIPEVKELFGVCT